MRMIEKEREREREREQTSKAVWGRPGIEFQICWKAGCDINIDESDGYLRDRIAISCYPDPDIAFVNSLCCHGNKQLNGSMHLNIRDKLRFMLPNNRRGEQTLAVCDC